MDPSEGDVREYLLRNPLTPFLLLDLPDVLILHILSFLDLSDLAHVSAAHPFLACLSRDTVLHIRRLRAVGPTVLDSHLRKRPARISLEVVQHLKGLNVRSRAGNGQYLGSPTSQRQFEVANRIGKQMLAMRLTKGLSSRPSIEALVQNNILDVELLHRDAYTTPLTSFASARAAQHRLRVSPTLAPALHLLKRELTKDELARRMRACSVSSSREGKENGSRWGNWKTLPLCAAQRGDAARWRDENYLSVRLAICPGVKSNIRFFEGLATA